MQVAKLQAAIDLAEKQVDVKRQAVQAARDDHKKSEAHMRELREKQYQFQLSTGAARETMMPMED